jgi:peroxiredoxin
MRPLLLLLLALPVARAADPLPGHSSHGEAFNEGPRQAAVLIEGTGQVDFPVQTSKPMAQRFFDQGIGQLHGFWYYEAERSFRQAAALDKDCAMAFWGMAMANVNNETRAKQFTSRAVALKDKACDSDRAWIQVLENFYLKKDDKRDKKQRELDFIRDLEAIVQDRPQDVEAKAFLVWKIWHAKREAPISSPQAVDALLDQIFAVAPNHPAHHYRIHLWDDRKPERALKSAALCGQAAPAIAHMWHMPGHTYSKVKRFDDAVWQQEASTRVDHAYMRREFVLPDQIHNYAHNEEWLVRNYNELGRAADAIALARSLIANPRHPKHNTLDKSGSSASYGRRRLLETLEKWQLWSELRATAADFLEPATQAEVEVPRLRALGLAAFQLDDAAGLDRAIADLEKFERAQAAKATADKKAESKAAATKAPVASADKAASTAKAAQPAKAKESVPASAVVAGQEAKPSSTKSETAKPVAAKAKAAESKQPDAKKPEPSAAAKALVELRVLRAVHGKQDDAAKQLEAAKDLPKDLAARLWLRLGDKAKAVTAANGLGSDLFGQAAKADLLHAAGRTDEARKAFEEARKLAFVMDRELPAAKRLGELAGEFGIKGDWRLPAPKRDDSGVRPPLDSLGPIHWSPPQAPDWEALTLEGKAFSSRELAGRNHLLIFYLGSACTHCMEQVNAFAKVAPEFEKAGLSITAVTSEPMSLAGRLVEQMSDKKLPPFPVLCDPSREAFKAFRAHDDFEEEPLHAAALVDAKGRLRWLDVSWEPFTDTKFLLAEARRLLALEAD